MPRFIVCYDIPENKRRTRLSRCLDAYGRRVQLSVYEMLMDESLLDRMIADVSLFLDIDEDLFTIYPLCKNCMRGVRRIGRDAGMIPPGEELLFVV